VDELVVRLPSAAMAVATVLAVVWFTWRRWDAAAGLCAGFILATSADFIRYARMARMDMTLTACLTAAWMLFERAVASPLPPPRPACDWSSAARRPDRGAQSIAAGAAGRAARQQVSVAMDRRSPVARANGVG
jgi:4-amino-4-deoxy-L-arabinose transferase-like glycosyltransferase